LGVIENQEVARLHQAGQGFENAIDGLGLAAI